METKDGLYILMLFVTLGMGLAMGHKIGENGEKQRHTLGAK